MKTIEIKKVASANEAIELINRLNYRNDTFVYCSTTHDDKAEYRHFDAYRENGEKDAFAMIEIVVNGKLEIVRFFNLFRDIIVDFKLGDFNPDDYDNHFDQIINADAQEETKKTIETKNAKNGAKIYYVNGKRVSREIALEAAAENREGNLFTIETGSFNEITKTVEYKATMRIADCPIKIRQRNLRHEISFDVIVSDVTVKSCYGHKDNAADIKEAKFKATVLANKIAFAYIKGAYGIRLIGGCDIKILNAPTIEADVEEYAVTVDAQNVAIDAEIELANVKNDEIKAEENTNTAETELYSNIDITAKTAKFAASKIITITQYNSLCTWAEKVSNGQLDAVIQIKTHLNEWLGYNVVIEEEIIHYIENDNMDGFRLYLAQFPFVVKDDAGYFHKLYVRHFDNTNEIKCYLAEIPSNEATILNAALETNDETELANTNSTDDNNGEEMKAAEYKYYLKSRRPINGSVPVGYIKAETGEVKVPALRSDGKISPAIKKTYFGTVIYNKPLSDEQILNYDLGVDPFNPKADTNTANVEKPDDFISKLGELKANVDAATVEDTAARDVEVNAYNSWQDAKQQASTAANKLSLAIAAYKHFGADKAKELTNNLIVADLDFFCKANIKITNQSDEVLQTRLSQLVISFYKDKFSISASWDKLAKYDTPAQVETAINQLKAAIKRGDKEFSFPTIEQLNTPTNTFVDTPDAPTSDTNDKHRDSLARAMKFALEMIQKYCCEKNLAAAQNEMELYNICSNAMRDLSGTASDTCEQINDAAPADWKIFPNHDNQSFQVKFKGKTIFTLDSLILAKILPPDKFFEQFKPLVDDNFSPEQQFLVDRYHELENLQEMRVEAPPDTAKTIDEMIDKLKRDIADIVLKL